MSTKTGAAQVTMEEAIQQLVELAQEYASYAKKSPTGNCLSIKSEDISVWVNFVNNVWFVNLGDVRVTTNANMITFPYYYTADDLIKTHSLYLSYWDKLNTDLLNRSEAEIEAERIAEIERLKSRLAQLERGEIEPESCIL